MNYKHWNNLFDLKLKPKLSMDITPLIDIVFLLVAFFMLTSSLGQEQSIRVDLPKAEKSKDTKSSRLTLSIKSDGSVYINKELYPYEVYKKKIIEYIDNRGRANIGNIVIRGDKKSPYEVVVGIMDTLSGIGIDNFSLAISKE